MKKLKIAAMIFGHHIWLEVSDLNQFMHPKQGFLDFEICKLWVPIKGEEGITAS